MYVSKEGTVAEYGMLAKDNIDEGEVLFTIPRSALLHQGTTKVSALLEKGKLSQLQRSYFFSSTSKLCASSSSSLLPAASPSFPHRAVVSGELFRLGPAAAGSAVRVHVLTVPLEALPLSVDRLQDAGSPHVLVKKLLLSDHCC